MTLARCCLLALLLVAPLCMAREAGAFECSKIRDEGFWTPKRGALAPRNVRPRLMIELAVVGRAKLPALLAEGATLECRSDDESWTSTAASLKVTAGYRYIGLEFTPNSPLPAKNTCYVFTPDGKKGPPFRTTGLTDKEPPSSAGLPRSEVSSCSSNWSRCSDGVGAMRLNFQEVHDDTSQGQLTLELWTAEQGEEIDYSAMPSNLSVDNHFGSRGECRIKGNFYFPPQGERIFFGVKLVDLAGNRSEPFEAWLTGPATHYQKGQMKELKGISHKGAVLPLKPVLAAREPGPPPSEGRGSPFRFRVIFLFLILLIPILWVLWEELRD